MNEVIKEIAAEQAEFVANVEKVFGEQQEMIKKHQTMLGIEQLAAAVRDVKLVEALRATLTALKVAAIELRACGADESVDLVRACYDGRGSVDARAVLAEYEEV